MELEQQVLRRYAETFYVNIFPCGLVIRPNAPHLGKVVNPSEDPPYGLVEVKCPDEEDIGEASQFEFVQGQFKLKKKHT